MCGTPVFVAVARMQGVPLAIALSIRSRISSVIVIIGLAPPFGACGAIAWVWPRQVNSESIAHVVVRCAIFITEDNTSRQSAVCAVWPCTVRVSWVSWLCWDVCPPPLPTCDPQLLHLHANSG